MRRRKNWQEGLEVGRHMTIHILILFWSLWAAFAVAMLLPADPVFRWGLFGAAEVASLWLLTKDWRCNA